MIYTFGSTAYNQYGEFVTSQIGSLIVFTGYYCTLIQKPYYYRINTDLLYTDLSCVKWAMYCVSRFTLRPIMCPYV